MVELDGFAIIPEDIDGTEEELIAYNYCLAMDYYDAIKREDFDSIGNIESWIITEICYWLNYDGKIGKNIEEEIELISSGKILTDNGRTLADAIVAEQKDYLAGAFINVYDPDPRLVKLNNEYITKIKESLKFSKVRIK